MLVLITYDVNTSDREGRRRLSRVAKICTNYGQRVQNSVFECMLSAAQLCSVTDRLRKEMDEEKDSIRIYHLGNSYEKKIEHYGAKSAYNPNDPMIF